jgi:hypothetical protein
MIHSDRENQRVATLIAVMAEAMRMIETSVEPCDPELKGLLRSSYQARAQSLRAEQAGFERRKKRLEARPVRQQSGRSLDNAHMAERQIGLIESTLDTVRARVNQLERMVPLNHLRLQGARAELELHEGLLAEWQEYDEELLRAEE